MQRRLVSSGSYLEPQIGFSRAVRVGDFISVAGTAPIGTDGKTDVVGDVYRQTVRCLEIVRTALEDAGGSIEDVVRTRIMLTDAKTWEEAARAHGEVFKDIRPATTVMEVSGFVDPDWLVEIEAEAICTPKG
ncbi:RidA family protein [Nisaea sp.]|uniref:RidA family protein n=1 Tax=Nisaea sp. TaxID=2024842 RepID=UPI0032EE6313